MCLFSARCGAVLRGDCAPPLVRSRKYGHIVRVKQNAVPAVAQRQRAAFAIPYARLYQTFANASGRYIQLFKAGGVIKRARRKYHHVRRHFIGGKRAKCLKRYRLNLNINARMALFIRGKAGIEPRHQRTRSCAKALIHAQPNHARPARIWQRRHALGRHGQVGRDIRRARDEQRAQDCT